MISAIQLVRNTGTFDSVNTGAQLTLNSFALIYAENGRGKTTLASILRSLGSNDPQPILERRRLGSQHPPHIVISDENGQQAVFQNGTWANNLPNIAVFDDTFVAQNVCSGMEIETGHRQNLHELIIGSQGVALNAVLQGYVSRIEQHNRDLQTKGAAIPGAARGTMSIDEFCALEKRSDIDAALQDAERNLAAARQSDAVRQRPNFQPFTLPEIDLDALETLLARGLPDLEAEATLRVQQHIAKLGDRGEAWISSGMARIDGVSAEAEEEICPFCAQDLAGSPLIAHYKAYFSEAYRELKDGIAASVREFTAQHSGEVQTAFERNVRGTEQARQFWKDFTDTPEIGIDTAEIAITWRSVLQPLQALLGQKQSSPLEQLAINDELREKVRAYNEVRNNVAALSQSLVAVNGAIDLVKEKAAAADVASLERDLNLLRAIKARYDANVAQRCDDYLAEKAAKRGAEGLRDTARQNLDQYRNQIFPRYEAAINEYLQRLNAGFRLDSVRQVNTRTGSTCNYQVLIEAQPVPLTSRQDGEPCFKNTLSAGDRNSLALAFFFASLEHDPDRASKIVVIDDPMTSLDEHRSLTTIQEMRRLADDVEQLIVLSHSKSFLCELWQGVDTTLRSAMRIVRSNPGSTFAAWDVNQDCINEHDKRHAMVREFIRNGAGPDERGVASALRPILEAFARVAYPEWFPPGTLLGPFLGICQQREGTGDQILTPADRQELRALLDYANQFHHDSNAAWQTVIINDQELLNFASRTLSFATR